MKANKCLTIIPLLVLSSVLSGRLSAQENLMTGELLIKKFDCKEGATYPDFGCNNETYIAEKYLEIETLSPLTVLAPGKIVEHTEHWLLAKTTIDETEASIDKNKYYF